MKRAIIIVLDSLGIGLMEDAQEFGDSGSNTLAAIANSPQFSAKTLQKLGFFNIDGVNCYEKTTSPIGSYARLKEKSKGKDTTIGHWELAGIVSEQPLPTFSDGFPPHIIAEFSAKTGKQVLCNKPYSGTDVLRDFGEEQTKTGALIVYTSADSVFQVAANEAVVPVLELYRCCEIARELLVGDFAVGRVIARPFTGSDKNSFKRSTNRHDYSLLPPKKTMLDFLQAANIATTGVGKIFDIFSGVGVSKQIKTTSNADGMQKTCELLKVQKEGLIFVNLVDFDMVFGHRNNIDGYAGALAEFDTQLAQLLNLLTDDDLLLITADHGCDPSTPSTDHSRECVPLILYQKNKPSVDFGVRETFADVGATVLKYFEVSGETDGKSLL